MAHILIADDDRVIHFIYSKIITALGHDITKCVNGLEAVDAVRDNSFDLIILDNMMPEMDGYKACQEIRRLPNGIAVPIIIVSADDSQESILKFLSAGANDYLLKPISEPILVAKLKNFLKTASLHKNEFEMVKQQATIADKYKICKVLGYGAHSVVFLAEHLEENRLVAVKLLNRHAVAEELLAPITELALKLQDADLDNVVEILGMGQYGDNIYIILEYADGGDLGSKLKQVGRMSEKEVVDVGYDIATALVSMAKNNITHLDLKPENVMIDKGVYKLSDFGVVAERPGTTMALTQEIWGTPAYSAPEVLVDSKNISIKSDIYSLAICLYESLVGDNPFAADKPAVSMFRQLNLAPIPLMDMGGHFSVECSALVDAMLSKDSALRPSPTELQKSFAYLKECFDESLDKQATYVRSSGRKPLEDTRALKPSPESRKTINETIEKFSKETDTHFPSPPSHQHAPAARKPPRPMSRQRFNLRAFFAKAAVMLVVFFALYSVALLAGNAFRSEPESSFKGIPSVVACENCGNIEVKDVLDISSCKCDKCGGQEWFAVRCAKCGKLFPLNEDKLADMADSLSDDEYDAEFDTLVTCPYCGSHRYEAVLPSDLHEAKK